MTKIETFADDEINEYLSLLRMLTNYLNEGKEPPVDLMKKVLSKERMEKFDDLTSLIFLNDNSYFACSILFLLFPKFEPIPK